MLPLSFYLKPGVVKVARDLIGKILVTNFNGQYTSGIISETEAYNGIVDRASHAYNNKRTKRNEIMYANAGTSYVYICYGMHHLFNVVTNEKDIPHAVLIRNIIPLEGADIMEKRRGKKITDKSFSTGPGTASVALGINKSHNGLSLFEDKIWIEDRGLKIKNNQIKITPRIGVESAGEDALLPYRFLLQNFKL
ncbi:MAG TPA: DNA-3-methyladenine glycosylase [Bacteroidia bacterium]|nr:DNA-3-methyladenine glycosylase [Bacteroidia bacterium]